MKNTYVCYMKFNFVRISHNIRDIGHVGKKHMTYWNHFLRAVRNWYKFFTV